MGTRTAVLFAVAVSALAGVARADHLLDDHLTIDRSLLLAQNEPPPPPPPPGYPPPTVQQPQPYYQPAPVYYQPMPQRPMRTEMRPRYGLFAAGLAIFGAAWLSDISITVASSHNPVWESFVPLIGPLLQTRDGVANSPDPNANGYTDSGTADVAKFFLVWDFIGQLAGLTMAVLGLVVQHQVVVYGDAAPPKPPKIQMALTPGPSGHGNGFAIIF